MPVFKSIITAVKLYLDSSLCEIMTTPVFKEVKVHCLLTGYFHVVNSEKNDIRKKNVLKSLINDFRSFLNDI